MLRAGSRACLISPLCVTEFISSHFGEEAVFLSFHQILVTLVCPLHECLPALFRRIIFDVCPSFFLKHNLRLKCFHDLFSLKTQRGLRADDSDARLVVSLPWPFPRSTSALKTLSRYIIAPSHLQHVLCHMSTSLPEESAFFV